MSAFCIYIYAAYLIKSHITAHYNVVHNVVYNADVLHVLETCFMAESEVGMYWGRIW